MEKVIEFAFKSARRISPEEVAAAKEAIKRQFDIDLPKRESKQ